MPWQKITQATVLRAMKWRRPAEPLTALDVARWFVRDAGPRHVRAAARSLRALARKGLLPPGVTLAEDDPCGPTASVAAPPSPARRCGRKAPAPPAAGPCASPSTRCARSAGSD